MNINVLKKEQLVTMLVEEHEVKHEEIADLKRPELINMLKTKVDVAGLLDTASMETEGVVAIAPNALEAAPEVVVEDVAEQAFDPSPLDLEWTPFVLSQLDPKTELIEGFPTCDGLRRVFEIHVGEIIDCTIDPISTPQANNNRATIKCTLRYLPKAGTSQYSGIKTISDISDCHEANTTMPFNLYMTATAATMAEGRCLRKGLRLKTVAREEVAGTKMQNAIDLALREASTTIEASSDNQKIAIAKVASNLNLSIKSLLSLMKKEQIIDGMELESLSYKDAQMVMRRLTDYERGEENKGLSIPVELFNK